MSPFSPSSLATLATSPKSFVSICARSATDFSTSNACEIASRIVPSPTPILSSSIIVLDIYFASVAVADDKSSKTIAIFLDVDLSPEILVNFLRLLNTKSISRGLKKRK